MNNHSHNNHIPSDKPHDHASSDEHHHEHDHQQENSCSQSSCCSQDKTETLSTLSSGSTRLTWQVFGMDCPSCAKKVETAVSQVAGVEHAKILFATEKLVVDTKETQDIAPRIEQAVKKAGYSLSSGANTTPAAKPSVKQQRLKEYGPPVIMATLILLSWLLELFSPTYGRIAFTITTIIGLIPIGLQAIRLTRSGTPFAIETLMSISAIGALFIGATEEAAMVLMLFMIGELLESYAANRARQGVSALMALLPEEAVRLSKNGTRETVAAASLIPGDIIEIAPGTRLPVDAELQAASASFDESALTGESIPVERLRGEKVAAGSLAVDSVMQLKVLSEPGNNAIDRILTLIEEAEERRAPIERFIDRFSRYYTPAIMLFALLVVIVPPLMFAQPWETWIYRGLTLLLIGCPCALVISTPAAITSALAAATRRGALIKGGAALEQLGTISQIAFDKTGTLTEGKPMVTDVIPVNEMTEAQLLGLSAAVESGSHHPLAQAIIRKTEENGITYAQAENRRAIAGVGVQGNVDNETILISSPSKLTQNELSAEQQQQITQLEEQGKTVVVTLKSNQVIGLLALRDTLRADAKQALAALKQIGVNGVMLTGDNPRAAAAIAHELNIEYEASLLPEDKVTAVIILNKEQPTAMVGDGINDAPAMKSSTIGIAMGGGTDVALETADAALTHNRLIGLTDMIVLSRATRKIIRQNITIALGLKAIFLVTSLIGLTGLWLAVLADSGATALVTANSLRLLRKRKEETEG
ncbi:zinc/cadmium/mercury/lead-transporting ATPase [Budviciaceae bacterium CWB-B4]|uniref:P-type Zn(2+) transporter n=1 Tax=Limnobaculum xujianqingii TaxID=2738837 RepID=A0A9D7AL80_9GAMM|nr:zinc/cadmium/mercury/lead-transporting ATPase [Limnobaculum xujianqingii]MBK5074931.1 zinc/cadmium/mercury/lead-transporting ATPase [Limnobaculum xujianqingii]MBK5178193.1 zinc/cadmium/mercury/lead-transporting ATPase [Limnobaculum xujianqingii]